MLPLNSIKIVYAPFSLCFLIILNWRFDIIRKFLGKLLLWNLFVTRTVYLIDLSLLNVWQIVVLIYQMIISILTSWWQLLPLLWHWKRFRLSWIILKFDIWLFDILFIRLGANRERGHGANRTINSSEFFNPCHLTEWLKVGTIFN